ncbi:bifunctional cobalt-precorrin-7 (C(5))-methyltransferase/cobalt-precorrin-6B (C(15))-methyltransferase [Mycolicibacterium cosmeticum]|uniref:Precorrin-6Y C5,15-methyltransferase n=1 Tax=Mycolicibacterium cosmeticum TaxID=258533 RepID=W9BL01_MYCCO|nr:bifunctional cobalt-precorrin-7 (C(5))-methyltransferase/cobalt-precorrin-6B (C(15))-methyltransferase [Mycolicibacterium cosmeticum]TLH73339.1 bifunctional cobalt-precorrin-7 (C(5))-methyltransferase/cobalt-precorrin-6B (C(15))-methyltransferase [Mycolicibacterium cosmeticum]CDO08790.1 precorrin-6Y C5,15-methyltransferase [Mycolicibacterium cosmeticum]
MNIVVVGIGADGMAGLSPASAAELRRATVVYGAPRQLELLDGSVAAQRREWPSPMLPALPTLFDGLDTAHVVASGDPMLHGVGATLVRIFGAGAVRVLPHVSSVTLACARLGWSVQDTEVISLVTADPVTAVRRGGQAVVLSRDGGTPAALARLLTETGRGASEFTVLEQLGGPGEQVRHALAERFHDTVDDLNVIAVRYLPDDRRFHTLPDSQLAHDGQITKQGIRAVTLAALGPRPGELLWDVGSGSGSIAVEWCRSGPGLRAVAFERDPQRRDRVASNARAFGVGIDVRGAAPDEFDGAPAPSAVFVGGGITTPDLLDGCFEHLAPGGRLVANVVTAESEAVVIQWYSTLGGQLHRFQHYRGEPVGGFTGFRPAYPVTQWSVSKP